MTTPVFAPGGIAKYAMPGDNPQAQAARQRKKSGLGLAGVGYLVASRHKDVTPGAVELITRKPKTGNKLAEVEHTARIERRTKLIDTASSRGGAAAVGLGLAMAGEGLASDWRHRHVLQRAKRKAGAQLDTFAARHDLNDPVSKAGKRKKDSAGAVPILSGIGLVGGGTAGLDIATRHLDLAGDAKYRAKRYGEEAVEAKINPRSSPNLREASALAAQRSAQASHVFHRGRALRWGGGGLGATAAGAGLVGLGVHRANVAGDQRRAAAKASYERRKAAASPVPVAKSAFGLGQIDKAFDPDRQMKGRQPLYQGAAVGAGTAALAGSGTLGVMARNRFAGAKLKRGDSEKLHDTVAERLRRHAISGSPGGLPGTNTAMALTNRGHTEAREFAEQAAHATKEARRVRAGAVGAGVLGAGLIGGAVGVHRRDREGRPVGFGL